MYNVSTGMVHMQTIEVQSSCSQGGQNEGEIGHFCRAKTTSFHRPNRCALHEVHKYATIKLRVKIQKVRKNCTQQLYTTDLGLSMWPLHQGAEIKVKLHPSFNLSPVVNAPMKLCIVFTLLSK